jgi:Phosphatidylserine decarboxylase
VITGNEWVGSNGYAFSGITTPVGLTLIVCLTAPLASALLTVRFHEGRCFHRSLVTCTAAAACVAFLAGPLSPPSDSIARRQVQDTVNFAVAIEISFVTGDYWEIWPTNYHRWHSPVAGTIVRAFTKDGTYYSEGADAVEPTNSQSYLAHVAARAIILIDADDPVIGLIAFVPVGMSEVSSCMIGPHVTPGYHVAKGEELGYFQFGGSTHCLVFRRGVIAQFSLGAIPQPHDPNAPLMLVRSQLATARTTR